MARTFLKLTRFDGGEAIYVDPACIQAVGDSPPFAKGGTRVSCAYAFADVKETVGEVIGAIGLGDDVNIVKRDERETEKDALAEAIEAICSELDSIEDDIVGLRSSISDLKGGN